MFELGVWQITTYAMLGVLLLAFIITTLAYSRSPISS